LDTYNPDTVYLRQQGCGDLWLFFKPKWVQEQKHLGNTGVGDK
jgi:hypothetical protein